MSNKAIELADKWPNTDNITDMEEVGEEMAKELLRLHAEAEGLRKDAARYRWLKTGFSPMGLDMSGNHSWQSRINPSTLRGANIDEAIDSAMQN